MSNFTLEKSVGSVNDNNYLSIELKLSDAPNADEYENLIKHLNALKGFVMFERERVGEDE